MSLNHGSWFITNDGGDDFATVEWNIYEVGPDGTVTNSTVVAEDVDYDFGNKIVEEHNKVRAFIRERQEYVDAAVQSNGDNADYHRWQGHMESRRQLAQALGLPFEFGARR